MLTIHYHHYSANYEKTDLWVWDARGHNHDLAGAIQPNDRTEFGCVFQVPLTGFAEHVSEIGIGFVVRPQGSWESRDGEDRQWQPAEAGQIWLIHGDPRIYTSRPDVSPQISSAWLDDSKRMVVRLSHPVELERLKADSFRVRSAAGPLHTSTAVHVIEPENGSSRFVEVEFGDELSVDAQLMVLFEDYQPGEVELRDILLDSERYYSDLPLGAICTREKTVVRVFAPGAHAVEVVLYDQPTGPEGREAHAMTRGEGGTWSVELEGDYHLRCYMIAVNG
ncbi:MAG: hypothetical protein JJU11_12970, partial [Candidatus Sumerlaeia bacterium]|nr:hypothetical protein [Candidatus Sumerlaeia bacterium]